MNASYYRKNKERCATYLKKWRAENKERFAAISRKAQKKWEAANIEKVRARKRRWAQKNATKKQEAAQ